MSSATLPSYPFPTECDIKKIEEACRANKHLSDESLLDRIQEDQKILEKYNLKKEDIYLTHRNMYLLFHQTDLYNAKNTKLADMDWTNDYFSPTRIANWCVRNVTTNEIKLNNQHLRIICAVYGGAETCPIEEHFSDKYHGYSRGDRDWFVTNLDTNENLWIPDLLPAQASMFGFFQSLEYRLDPEKYIRVMNISSSPELLEFDKVDDYKYRLSGFTYSKEDILQEDEIISTLEADYGTCIVAHNREYDVDCVYVKFKNIPSDPTLLGCKLNTSNITITNKYELCIKYNEILYKLR